MIASRAPVTALARRVPWWALVFLLALGCRLAFVFLADEPMLYSHPYNYFNGGLSIAEHPRPLEFVLESDAWHLWLGPWTIAPLYYLFVGGCFLLFGPHLLPVVLLQCAFDAATAAMVGRLGRAVAGPRGLWAGVAYAVNWHAVEQPASTLTENLHTVLLVSGVTLLVAEAERRLEGPASGREHTWRTVLGGFMLGFSGLARSVSTAFVPMAALWRYRHSARGRRGLLAAVTLCAAGAAAVLPWTARNVVFIGDFVPVESISVYNLWDDNHFVSPQKRHQQEMRILGAPTPAEGRALALRFTVRGIAGSPLEFLKKGFGQFFHFLRLDGLHLLLALEHPQPAWRHVVLVLLDDLIVLPTVVLFAVFVAGGRPSAARSLILAFSAYYVLMVVLVFHNEIRYRSTLLPFALAAAAGGLSVLLDPARRRRPRTLGGLALGCLIGGAMLAPHAAPLFRAARALPTIRAAEQAVRSGDLSLASSLAFRAASTDRVAARPWLRYGRALAASSRPAEALEAYARAEERKPFQWTPRLVRPQLLGAVRDTAGQETATAAAHHFSWHVDPWQALEIAWRELDAPLTDEVLLARNDYGAVRGFSNPHRDHRWSRHEAFVRLRPTVAATSYDVTLEMASPEPSPHAAPTVRVQARGAEEQAFVLGRETRAFVVRASPDASGALHLRLRSPTWNKVGFPAEQGIRLHRVAAVPVR